MALFLSARGWRCALTLLFLISGAALAHGQTRGVTRQRTNVSESDVASSSPELEVDVSGFSNAVRGMAFSRDDRLLAAAGIGAVRVWNIETGELPLCRCRPKSSAARAWRPPN